MNKRELIEAIASINRTATWEFLSEFSMRELSDYMKQLTSLGLVPSQISESADNAASTMHGLAV